MIEIRELIVKYDEMVAVDRLSLHIPEGACYGFVGPNGAGKTSTIRALATLLPPDSGSLMVCGHDVGSDPDMVKKSIGYMPDFFGVYDQLAVVEYLEFFALIYGVAPSDIPAKIDFVLEKVRLEVKKEAYIDTLSRGMKQRLALARSIIHDPPVLILDEPASGLDPGARKEFRLLVKSLQQAGKTILISSHILLELADICDHVAIIEAGKLVVSGPIEQMLENVRDKRSIVIRLSESPTSKLVENLRGLKEVIDLSVEDQTLCLTLLDNDLSVASVVSFLVDKKMGITEVRSMESDLEEIFGSVTKGVVR